MADLADSIQELDVVTSKRVSALLQELIALWPAIEALHRPHIELLKQHHNSEIRKWLEAK